MYAEHSNIIHNSNSDLLRGTIHRPEAPLSGRTSAIPPHPSSGRPRDWSNHVAQQKRFASVESIRQVCNGLTATFDLLSNPSTFLHGALGRWVPYSWWHRFGKFHIQSKTAKPPIYVKLSTPPKYQCLTHSGTKACFTLKGTTWFIETYRNTRHYFGHFIMVNIILSSRRPVSSRDTGSPFPSPLANFPDSASLQLSSLSPPSCDPSENASKESSCYNTDPNQTSSRCIESTSLPENDGTDLLWILVKSQIVGALSMVYPKSIASCPPRLIY